MKRVWVLVKASRRVGYVPAELWEQQVFIVFYPQNLLLDSEEGDERSTPYGKNQVEEIKDQRLVLILERDYGTLQSARQKVKDAREALKATAQLVIEHLG